jgi:uncharacterized protein (TIGR02118 family)
MTKKLIFLLQVVVLMSFLSCKTTKPNQRSVQTVGLFKVTILYPSGDDKTFDIDYYEKKHMPMVAGFIGSNLKFYEIDKGIAGRTPADKIPYLAVGYFYIIDVAAYNKAIMQNRESILGDFKNYTNIQPIILISEIKQVQHYSTK